MRNMKFLKAAVAGAALVAGMAVSRPASATPSGLINLPSTDLYEKGTIHLDVDYIRFLKDSGLNADDNLSAGLTYGVGPDTDKPFGRTEIGFDYNINRLAGTRSGVGNNIFFNVKTQLYNNDEQGLRSTIGIYNVGKKTTSGRFAYINASKNFGREAGRLTLGYIRQTNNSLAAVDKNTFQIGYDKLINDKVQLIGEYGTGKGPLGAISGSVIYYLNDRSNIQLAYSHLNNSGFPQRNFIYLGYDINFGTRAAAPAEPNPEGEARN